MAFEGGPLSVIGITPQYLTGLATQTASSGVPQVLGQVWKGSGQSFLGSAGQGLAGSLAGSAVNVALNSAFGTSAVGPQGFSLNSGANILASVVTPQITGALSAGINQQIEQSLQSAGPFGAILSDVATGLVDTAIGGITDSIFGGAAGGLGGAGGGTNYKMFPGGGGEPAADYGGSSFTLGLNGGDVVFSLQPAYQGPQASGAEEALSFPKEITTLPFDQLTSLDLGIANPVINSLKSSVMSGNFLGDVVSTATGLV